MMPTPPDSPAEPAECRRRAEDLARTADGTQELTRAVAWALLAIAGELRTIRRQLDRKGR